MSVILLTALAVELLSLSEAMAFLRVEHNDGEDVIVALAAASRIQVEVQTVFVRCFRVWRLSMLGTGCAKRHTLRNSRGVPPWTFSTP
jgi:uncharacterized phiE125 gp8 family phage protein